jgi:hypothetical protein
VPALERGPAADEPLAPVPAVDAVPFEWTPTSDGLLAYLRDRRASRGLPSPVPGRDLPGGVGLRPSLAAGGAGRRDCAASLADRSDRRCRPPTP